MRSLLVFILVCASFNANCQKPSPCPDVFTYEEQNLESGRWKGVINLKTDEELAGITLNIGLDNPGDSMGNYFGESTTKNNKDFWIKNENAVLEPNKPKMVKFYVKFDLTKPIPSLERIRLNGRSICRKSTKVEVPKTSVVTPKPSNAPQNVPVVVPTVPILGDTEIKTDIKMTDSNPIGPIPISSGSLDFFPGDSVRPPLGQNRPPILNLAEPACGTVSQKVTPLIVNGFNTTEGQFPWHIAIYASDSSKVLRYICGGSLISKDEVLTAAHCVTIPRRDTLVDLQRLQIYLGTSNLVQFDSGVQFRQIQSAKVHPQFNPRNYFNDIAILKLKTPVVFSDYVRPICLWEGDTSIDKLYKSEGVVVGWGHDDSKQITDVLKGGYMPIVDTQTCIWSNREFFSQVTFEKNYCAGYREGANVCNGDSGGGMVFRKNNTSGSRSVWHIRGLVSIGVALQNSAQCDPTNYAVFTDVAKHLDFINDVVENKAIKERYGDEGRPIFL